MSALAKQLIREERAMFRRLAHSGLYPDKHRMLMIKGTLENMGASVNKIVQGREHFGCRSVYIEITAEPPRRGHVTRRSTLKTLIERAIIKAGYGDDMLTHHRHLGGEPIEITTTYNDRSFRAGVELTAIGKFTGALYSDGKFV